jgi:hypothetical protein
MSRNSEIIGAACERDQSLVQSIFGEAKSDGITEQLEEFIERAFGDYPEFLFCRLGVGFVVGARVGDQDLVLKIHVWRSSLKNLLAIQRLQSELYDACLPVARPLISASALGNGIVTVETMLQGQLADGRSAAIRKVLAKELHRFIETGRHVADRSDLDVPALLSTPESTPWPTPHSRRFDFDANRSAALWIDDLGRAARLRLSRQGEDLVVGHLDWRVENVGFDGPFLTAIYDMDSVGVASEAFIVGCAAASFSTNWQIPGGNVPKVSEMADFIVEYEEARGMDFGRDDLDIVDAANLLLVAYGARCQSSDLTNTSNGGPTSSQGWVTLLSERGESGLLSR